MTVHGPIDDDLYPYYRELGDEVGLIAISDRQRALAPELNWVGSVHNGLRVEDWPFRADKQDYALFLGRFAPYKGAHLAVRAAHEAGIPLVLAGKCDEPAERPTSNKKCARCSPTATISSDRLTRSASANCSPVRAACCSRCYGRSRSGW